MSVVLTVLVLLLLRPCGAHRHLHGVRQPSKRSCGHAHMVRKCIGWLGGMGLVGPPPLLSDF